MKGKTLRRRIVAWILTLAMVLTTVNLPALSIGVKATGGDPSTFTVTFDKNGATGTESMDSQTFNTGEKQKLTANGFTNSGKSFAGWNTSSDGTGTSYTDEQEIEITENITLYAQWLNEYKVTFNKNDSTGTETMDEQTFIQGKAQTLTKNTYTNSGKRFNGWNTSSDGTGTSYTDEQEIEITENITLYAQWVVVYSVTFVDEDGTTVLKEAVAYDDGTTAENIAKPENPTKEATAENTYTFDKWVLTTDSSKGIEAVTSDATYKATYTSTKNKYNITFVNEDGTTVLKEAVAYEYGTTAENIAKPENPTKEATAENTYTFDKWVLTTDSSKGIEAVTSDATYKATYTSTKNKYNITFVNEDGTTVLKEAVAYDYGTTAENIEKPENPTKEADAQYTYEFSGWSPEVVSVSKDATYIAQFESIPQKYGITYELNEGKINSGEVKNYIYGKGATLPTDVTRSGYTFEGWCTDPSLTTIVTSIGVTETEDKKFYAKWEIIPATAPVVTDPTDVNMTYGDDGKISVSVTKDSNYDYSYQWYYEKDGSITKIKDANEATYSIPVNSSVGTYDYYCTVTAKRKDNEREAQITSKAAKVTINQRTAILNWGTEELIYTYNGTKQCPTPKVDNLVEDDKCTVTVEGGEIDANKDNEKYTATATGLDNENYVLPDEKTVEFTIAKAKWETPAKPEASEVTGNTVTLIKVDGCVYSIDKETWQDSNIFENLTVDTEYTFYQKKKADDNHIESVISDGLVVKTTAHKHEWSFKAENNKIIATCADSDKGHGEVKTAELEITATGKSYDGTVAAVEVTGSIDGVDTPEIVFKKGNDIIDAPSDAGTYTANITIGEGESAVTASAEYEIAKAVISVGDIVANDKEYDGNNKADLDAASITFTGKVGTEDVGISADGIFEDANAGTEKTVTITITLTGEDSDNYVIAETDKEKTVKANITPKGISVEWKNIEFVYDGNKHAPTATAKDLIEGDTCNVVVEGEKIDANADGQTYTATATLSNTNYELKDSATQTFTIKRADGTVSGTCADIVYENKFKPAISNTTNTGAAVVWYYREEGAAYKEWKESDSIPSVGNYEIYAKVAATNNYNECESSVIKVKVTQADPKYTVPKATAFCGDKLSEVTFTQPDNGEFVWVNQDIVVKEGSNVVDVKFVPKDTKNYKSVDKISLEVEAVHDFAGFTHLTHVEAVAAVVADKKAGLREYYECATCGKKIGTDKEVHNDSYFIIPCVPKSIDITLGTTKKIDSYVLDGSDGVKTTSIDSTTKYKKYLTFDESTGTIKTPSSGQYYKKKKLGTPTITVTDQAGETHKVKLNLKIRKPAAFNVSKKYIGNDIYEYTLECKAAYADNITIEVLSGFANKSNIKKLNKILKDRIKNNINVSKKKATVKISFTATKKSIKGKLRFQAVAKYGKNKSLASVKSK